MISKRLSVVIMALGIILILWGGVIYLANRRLIGEGNVIIATASDVLNYAENRRRDESRNRGMYLGLGGTIIFFAGLAARVVSRGK